MILKGRVSGMPVSVDMGEVEISATKMPDWFRCPQCAALYQGESEIIAHVAQHHHELLRRA